MSFSHFFLTGCVGWNIVLLISSEKLGTFSFFLLFFSFFCPFSKKPLFGPFCPFCTPSMGAPHHQWPKFLLLCPLCVISPWVTLPMDFINDFFIFSWKWPFFHFWPFWSLRTPLYGRALIEWGFREDFYGPQAIPWTQPQLRKKGQFNRKRRTIFGTPQQYTVFKSNCALKNLCCG